MRRINKPNYSPKEVFLLCVSRVRDPKLKARLETVADDIAERAKEYDERAAEAGLYTLPEHDDVSGVVSGQEMQGVYTSRMARKRAPGRRVYDQIVASAPNDMCPLCGQGLVASLDHHLPKTSFPSFTVTPYNLVPSCDRCNKTKLDVVPSNAEEQTLHPYYDDTTKHRWLYASVLETAPASIRFFVEVQESSDGVLRARIESHFNTFKLGALYAAHAGAELANIRAQLEDIHSMAGAEAVREHLETGAESRRRNHANSWQTAMYSAMTSSRWFCNGGFRAL